jgi:hypothetical protein
MDHQDQDKQTGGLILKCQDKYSCKAMAAKEARQRPGRGSLHLSPTNSQPSTPLSNRLLSRTSLSQLGLSQTPSSSPSSPLRSPPTHGWNIPNNPFASFFDIIRVRATMAFSLGGSNQQIANGPDIPEIQTGVSNLFIPKNSTQQD